MIVGFTNAAALIIGLSKPNKVLGVSMPCSKRFVKGIWAVLQQVGDTHVPTLTMGVVAFAIMWEMKKYLPKLPGVLVTVAVTTLTSRAMASKPRAARWSATTPSGLPTLPTEERVIAIGFDGELHFANLSYFQDAILGPVADHPDARDVLVVSDGINQLDASGEGGCGRRDTGRSGTQRRQANPRVYLVPKCRDQLAKQVAKPDGHKARIGKRAYAARGCGASRLPDLRNFAR